MLKIADPLTWIDEHEPLVRCWIAHFNRTGWPDRQFAILANEIYQLGSLIAAAKGVRLPERSPSDWLPAERADNSQPAKIMTNAEQLRWAAGKVRPKRRD